MSMGGQATQTSMHRQGARTPISISRIITFISCFKMYLNKYLFKIQTESGSLVQSLELSNRKGYILFLSCFDILKYAVKPAKGDHTGGQANQMMPSVGHGLDMQNYIDLHDLTYYSTQSRVGVSSWNRKYRSSKYTSIFREDEVYLIPMESYHTRIFIIQKNQVNSKCCHSQLIWVVCLCCVDLILYGGRGRGRGRGFVDRLKVF